MKAFTLFDKGDIRLVDIREPAVGREEVLINVHYVGLCGSDLNSFRGLMPLVTFPRIPGHEISGVITDKGIEVPDDINIGSKVTVLPYTNCGKCTACRTGHSNACEFNQTMGVQRDGALTHHIAVDYRKVYTSLKLSFRELAMVEPFSVGYHAANRGGVNQSDIVLIIGCGAIGIGALASAVDKGAKVLAVDIDESKLILAKKLGAVYTINSTKVNVLKSIQEFTNNRGVSVVIEAVGSQETYTLSVEAVSFAGRIVFIGYPKKEVLVNAPMLVKKEINIYGSRNALNVFPSVINMFETKNLPLEEMITGIFPFEKTPEAFEYWDNNAASTIKIMIKIDG